MKIKSHWLAGLLGRARLFLEIENGEFLASSKSETYTLVFSDLTDPPSATEGLIFATLAIGDKQFGWLPKNQTTSFLTECYRAWYLSRINPVQEFQQKATHYMANCYVRSSKYQQIQQMARGIKENYKKTPPPSLLPSDKEQLFNFIDQILSKDDNLLENYRSAFVRKESERFRSLFDTVESNPLTDKQREACVVDNDNNLVLAGAGTGKTSTMVGKAGYLVKSGKAQPEEILLLAFGNKAAKELQERIESKLDNSSIRASTFHSLGKAIITFVDQKSPGISDLATDDKKRNKYIDDCLNQLLTQEDYKKKAVTYFEKYLCPDANPFDFKTKGEYLEYLEANDIRSLKGDVVKSHGELLIANFLFVHGIEYQYEALYRIKTQTLEFRQYKPDFYLTEHGIYLEHYGIDRNSNTAPYIDSKKYNDGIKWKRQTHQENDTICLETFHYEKQEGILLDSLADQLGNYGVELNPFPEEGVLETLRELGRISMLSKLLSDLLENIKNQCATIDEAVNIARRAEDSDQAMAALDLLVPIIEQYEQTLRQKDEIDFNDMIHRATRYVSEGRYTPSWRYILIDEFQDISSSRANLVKALRNYAKECVVFCVGDDWQSIYRFTGSDLNYTTSFGVEFGDYSLVNLDKTYRFNNSICDVATKFVTRNPIQEKKQLVTHEQVHKPAVSILRASDSCNLDHVDKALERISAISDKPSSVYVISRYNFLVDKSKLAKTSKQYQQLKVNQISMHGSKGKEADFVIVVGLEKGKNGFPSERITHPLLELYLPPEESYPNAEERRLFYVAITRAKKRAYLIADMSKASVFMTELLEKDQYELCLDEFETPIEQIKYQNINCPSCTTGTLTLRTNQGTQQKFLGCSNYKRCTYRETCCPKCDSAMMKEGRFKTCITCGWKVPMCLKCSGEMRKRSTGHWGCSNYRRNQQPSCGHQESSISF